MKELKFRDYQEEAIEHILATTTGHDLVKMPTGAGKTIVMIHVAKVYLERGTRCLILLHREHLIAQVLARFAEFYPHIIPGVVRGESRDWDSDVVVASVATATNDIDMMPTDFGLVITDEAHRCIAPTYFSIYQRLGLINREVFDELVLQAMEGEELAIREKDLDKVAKLRKKGLSVAEVELVDKTTRRAKKKLWGKGQMRKDVQRKVVIGIRDRILGIEAVQAERRHIGLTATPQRTDELGLGSVFSGVPYSCGVRELIDQGHLTDLSILPVRYRVDKTSLRAMLRDGKADEQAVALWKEHASDRRSTMSFCVNIRHAEHFAEVFRDAGIPAEAIHSKLPKLDRAVREKAFRAGELKVMSNVGVFVEGFDVPHLDCIIMARDTDSATLIPQALGRGMRKFEGKKDCFVIDLADSIDAETLSKEVEIFRKIKVVGAADDEAEVRESVNVDRTPKAGETHEYLLEPLRLLRKMVVDSTDGWAWFPFMKINGVALDLSRTDQIYIGESPSGFYGVHVKNGRREEVICKERDNVEVCKDEALRYMVDRNMESVLSQRDCAWRLENATSKQRSFLKLHRVDIASSCSRGEASDLISTVKLNSEGGDEMSLETLYDMVARERVRQREKWGDQSNKHDFDWFLILSEEVGEVAKCALEGDVEKMRVELVQCMAVIETWLTGDE